MKYHPTKKSHKTFLLSVTTANFGYYFHLLPLNFGCNITVIVITVVGKTATKEPL